MTCHPRVIVQGPRVLPWFRARRQPRSPSTLMSQRNASRELVRGLLSGFELAKTCDGAINVDLPFGWQLETYAEKGPADSDDEEGLPSVVRGLKFVLTLPDGTQVSTWSGLRKALQETLQAEAREANPLTQDEENCRRGSRKRMRPLEYWSNERARACTPSNRRARWALSLCGLSLTSLLSCPRACADRRRLQPGRVGGRSGPWRGMKCMPHVWGCCLVRWRSREI